MRDFLTIPLFALTGAVYALMLNVTSLALAQATGPGAELLPGVPPGWAEVVVRAAAAVLICLAIIEGLRWVVPGWERETGVRLSDNARRALFLLVVLYGQAAALIGWPDATFVRTPWVGEVMASIGAGIVVSVCSLVFNELLWKRAMMLAQDKLGVMPKRVKARRLAAMTTGEFRVARSEEQTPTLPPSAP